MKFTNLFLAAAAILPVFGAAVPSDESALEARALNALQTRGNNGGLVIAKSISKITTAVAGLDKAILGVKTSTDAEIGAVLDALGFQTQTITNQTAIVKKAAKIEENCVDYVQWFVQRLINAIDKLATDLIGKKSALAIGGYDALVPSILVDQQTLANTFADVLITKVPKDALATAKNDKKEVNDAFNRIYAVYGQP